jgi:hypothetical protein
MNMSISYLDTLYNNPDVLLMILSRFYRTICGRRLAHFSDHANDGLALLVGESPILCHGGFSTRLSLIHGASDEVSSRVILCVRETGGHLS